MTAKNIFALALILSSQGVMAAENSTFEMTIKNHRFEPAEITVPAGKKVKLLIHNSDTTAEEFESYQLNREKIIPGGKQAVIYIGPLKAGNYPFFGEFHEDTAKGVIIVQ